MNTKLMNVAIILVIVCAVAFLVLWVVPSLGQRGEELGEQRAEAKQESLEQKAQNAILSDPRFLSWLFAKCGGEEYGDIEVVAFSTVEPLTSSTTMTTAQLGFRVSNFGSGSTIQVTLTNSGGTYTVGNMLYDLPENKNYDLDAYR